MSGNPYQRYTNAPNGAIEVHDPYCPWVQLLPDGEPKDEPFPARYTFLCCCDSLALARWDEHLGEQR